MLYFQDLIRKLLDFWADQAHCIIHQGYDLEVGAGTFNPATFLRCLGPEPYRAVYVEPSRRPKDGRYGQNPNRVQAYHQMQVILKPSPPNVLSLYLDSLKAVGLDLKAHDIRFVHDDWENPTIGASGLGWEVWLDGMEITQFTYFQNVGGLAVKPVSGEITYGLERLAMYLQGVDSIFDIHWCSDIKYGDIFQRSEREWSHYNFEEADIALWRTHFDNFEAEAKKLISHNLAIPAYDFVIKASHAFNLLDARGVISVTERTSYIGRIRHLARLLAEGYLKSRQTEEFPLMRLHKSAESPRLPPLHPPSPAVTTQDFLLEVGCEELPASFVEKGIHGLAANVKTLLTSHGLSFSKIDTFGTPRRLALIVRDLECRSAAQMIEKRGPSVAVAFDASGAPTEIGLGFLRTVGFDAMSRDQIRGAKRKDLFIAASGAQAEYLFVNLHKPAILTHELLQKELPKVILDINFPKKMRWDSLDIEFARPIRSIIALFGHHDIPFAIGSVVSGRTTVGHRQLSDQLISIDEPLDYVRILKEHHVLVDVHERRTVLEQQLEAIEKQLHATLVERKRLVDEVVQLVEWPFCIVGHFDKAYLKAPKEVLISEMIEHQRNFPLADAQGNLMANFVVVANQRPTDAMRHGFERALAPRLADGLFLYEEDCKTKLEKQLDKLATVTFLADLGSMKEKTRRLLAYVSMLHPYLNETSFSSVSLETLCRAALLCKADLATHLVGEFPELQGVAGRIYAQIHGESDQVALAIEEHWLPRAEHGPLPATAAGIVLALADKIDNLLCCFALGLIPTSSSDPYALRRQTLGLIRICIDHEIHLPLPELLQNAFEILSKNPECSEAARECFKDKENIIGQIMDFITQRLRTVLVEKGFKKDEIEAVLVKPLVDIYDRYRLVEALHSFRANYPDPFQALLTVYYRAKKLLTAQKKQSHIELHSWIKGKLSFRPIVNPDLFEHVAERVLFEEISQLEKEFDVLLAKPQKDYGEALRLIAMLYHPLATLFEEVRLLDEKPKIQANRLALLGRVLDACESLLDLSKIQEH